MPGFDAFDTRGYRTVDVRRGYREWVGTYEDSVDDAMDLALLDDLDVDWAAAGQAVDLACGTGRTGRWLRAQGVGAIDGVDLTSEMLDAARRRGLHRRLVEADVARTGLPSNAYGLLVAALVDEHLAVLDPLYAEAARLARPGATFVLVGLHPHFIMASGMPTHFESASGESVAIETHVHLCSEHVGAARAAGWWLVDMRERVVDEAWVARKPSWAGLRGHPVSFAFAWSSDRRG